VLASLLSDSVAAALRRWEIHWTSGMASTPIPWFVVAICYGAGVLIIALAIPLILRRVKPNRAYGVRFPSTLADESVWYDINARGGRHLAAIAVVYLALLTVGVASGQAWSVELRILVPMIVLVVALVADAIILGVAASRLLARRRAMKDRQATSKR
jgi:uncharacterized membrane protein